MNITSDLDLYAKLLNSVKVSGKHRPLSPFEVSEFIIAMINQYQSDEEVMFRLGIKNDMLKAFVSLQQLPTEYRRAVIWGRTNQDGISFSSAHQIVRMKSTEEEKKKLLEATLRYRLTKSEIGSIVSLFNREPNLSIEDCIEKVKRIRPILEIHHILILPIKPDSFKLLDEIAIKQAESSQDLVRKFVISIVPSERIYSVSVSLNYVIISLDKTGYNTLVQYMQDRKIFVNQLLEHLMTIGKKYGQ